MTEGYPDERINVSTTLSGSLANLHAELPAPRARACVEEIKRVIEQHQASWSIDEVSVVMVDDQEPDLSYLDKKSEHDARLLREYGSQWRMVGIYATAQVKMGDVEELVMSSGLWGIESFSEHEYFEFVAREELDLLRDDLVKLGFTRDECDDAGVDPHQLPARNAWIEA